jgi:DNA polymerase
MAETLSCERNAVHHIADRGNLAYEKPKVGTNKFGGECITYEGVGATKKWERLESTAPNSSKTSSQATARDILCYAMPHSAAAPS